ncbi:MAG: hypothetical protein PHC61_10075 [Chitinivibrionales bacterium]|nr:hypothetical protein [Chitinivibrionales bacterium]
MTSIASFLSVMTEKNASDLHLRVGVPPTFRIDGHLFRAQMEPI